MSAKCLICALAWVAAWQAAARQTPVEADFDKRVSEYVKLHNKAAGDMPKLKPTDSAESIAGHQHELARRISQARAGGAQGDIFTPEITSEFQRLMALAMQGHRAKHIRRSLNAGEPNALPALRINGEYPAGVPLQSMPPSLLLNLPKLPKEVEYRLIGHTLVLLDVEANLVVDFIPDAIPAGRHHHQH